MSAFTSPPEESISSQQDRLTNNNTSVSGNKRSRPSSFVSGPRSSNPLTKWSLSHDHLPAVQGSPQELSTPTSFDSSTNFSAIFKRLADIEARLDSLVPLQGNHRFRHSTASESPAASYPEFHSDQQLTDTSTAVFNYDHTIAASYDRSSGSMEHHSIESSSTENVLDLWWTFSVRDTLKWPIFNLEENEIMSYFQFEEFSDEDTTLNIDGYISNSLERSLDSNCHKYQDQHCLDDFDEMLRYVQRFLQFVHIKNPLLDPKSLLKQCETVVENGLDWTGETCLLLLVCALGAIASEYDINKLEDYSKPATDAVSYARSQEYFDAGMKRIGLLIGYASLTNSCCLFMAGSYYMYTLKPFAAWRLFNSASIGCKSFLTRQKTRQDSDANNSQMTELRSLEARLYWTCIKSEREVAVELGFDVSSLSFIEHPYSLPSPPLTSPSQSFFQGHQSSAETQIFGANYAFDQERSWYYYLTDITIRKLEMQIDGFLSKMRQKRPSLMASSKRREQFYYAIITNLVDADREILLCHAGLPSTLSFPLDEPFHSADDLREYLRFRMLFIRRNLSRPALYFLLHSPPTEFSPDLRAKMLSLADRTLAIDVQLALHGLITHRNHGTWLGICGITQSCLELIAAKKAALTDLILPPNLDQSLQVAKRAISYWGAESAGARMCLLAISRLEGQLLQFSN